MMKSLATYVMKGPKEAALVCVILGCMPVIGPWFSGGTVALIILQVGLKESIKVLPWAFLPAVAWLFAGDLSLMLMLPSVILAAAVLRTTFSLGYGLATVAVVCAIAVVIVQVMFAGHLDALTQQMTEILSTSESMKALEQTQKEGKPSKEEIEELITLLIGMAFAWGTGLTTSLVLLLGRWWQSLLYSPGAFQKEFHRYRLSFNVVIGLLIAMGLLSQLPNYGYSLVALLSLPFLFAGIALLHGLAKQLGLSGHWLALFYVSLMFAGHLLYLPVVLVAILDAGIDIRSKLISQDDDSLQ